MPNNPRADRTGAKGLPQWIATAVPFTQSARRVELFGNLDMFSYEV